MKGIDWLGEPIRALGGKPSAVILIIALLFPLGYGAYDKLTRNKWNFFSALGLLGVLLTGGIGLLELPAEWIAIKEAAIPLIIGLILLGSLWADKPLIRVFLYRPEIFQVEKIDAKIESKGTRCRFEAIMRRATAIIAGSFLLSAVLNYVLARIIVRSPSHTEEFTRELGRMMGWSYPVIVVPAMIVMGFALWYCIRGIRETTGLTLEEIINDPKAGQTNQT